MIEWVLAIGLLYSETLPDGQSRAYASMGERYESKAGCMRAGSDKALKMAARNGAGGAVVFCVASDDPALELLWDETQNRAYSPERNKD